MKKLLFILALCLGLVLPMSAQKHFTATLTEATVYLHGASLTHTAKATLKSGSQEVIIEGLSPQIELNSLKVSANGVLISGTEFRVDYITPREKSQYIQKLNDSLKLDKEQLQAARDELATHQQMLKLVTDGTYNNMQQKDKAATIADINANMELYQAKATALKKSIYQDQQLVNKLQETVTRLQQQIQQDSDENAHATGILCLSTSVPKDVTTTFTITYFTNQAQWIPCYEVNIPSMAETISLQAKAKVQQVTGLDWTNVRLTLSNGTPNRYSVAPVFTTWFLRFQAYGYRGNRVAYESNVMAPAKAQVSDASGIETVDAEEANNVIQLSMDDYVEVDAQDIHVTYSIAIPYDIPGNGQPKLIDLKAYDIKSEFKYYSIPKLSDETYLIAILSDYEQYNLLPGEATITYNSTYVGKTFLHPNDTKSQITLTLTTEPRMAVKREKQRDYCETKHVGNTTTITQSYLITVKNNLNRAAKLTLKDQYPISSNKDIEVRDVTAKPAATTNNSEIGVITWDVELQPGESRTFTISYSVKYPKDKNLNYNF